MLYADVVSGWDDVEVGYLLGRGSSGSVYRAKWNGKHVAVKVIASCCFCSADQQFTCGSLFAILAVNSFPNQVVS